MAVLIPCGRALANETAALKALERRLPADWLILANIPRRLAGREIDALVVAPRGLVVLELKSLDGALTVTPTGPWLRGGAALRNRHGQPVADGFQDQAEIAAQRLRTALVGFDPALKPLIYVDSAVVITHPRATLSNPHPSLKDTVALLPGALEMIEARLARSRKTVTLPVLEKLFAFIGQPLPPVAAAWGAPAQAARKPAAQARSTTKGPPKPAARPTRAVARGAARKSTSRRRSAAPPVPPRRGGWLLWLWILAGVLTLLAAASLLAPHPPA